MPDLSTHTGELIKRVRSEDVSFTMKRWEWDTLLFMLSYGAERFVGDHLRAGRWTDNDCIQDGMNIYKKLAHQMDPAKNPDPAVKSEEASGERASQASAGPP